MKLCVVARIILIDEGGQLGEEQSAMVQAEPIEHSVDTVCRLVEWQDIWKTKERGQTGNTVIQSDEAMKPSREQHQLSQWTKKRRSICGTAL